MDNKDLGPDFGQASHNEKHGLGDHSDIPPGSGARRGSTALNIVENPLQVRFDVVGFLGNGNISWPLGDRLDSWRPSFLFASAY